MSLNFEVPVPVEDILNRLGLTFSTKGNECSLLCPFHNEKTPSFSINKNTSQYNCFGCREKGNWYSLIKKLTGEDPYKFLGIDNPYFKESIKSLNNSDVGLSKHLFKKRVIKKQVLKEDKKDDRPKLNIIGNTCHPFDDEEAREYCKLRNVNRKDCNEYSIQYLKDGYIGLSRYYKRLIIPIKSREGDIVSYEGRDITKRQTKKCIYPFKSRNGSTLFDLDRLDYSKPTIFCESILDSLAIKKVVNRYFNSMYQVTTAFGIQLSYVQIDIVNKFSDDIILFFDPDDGGTLGIEIFDERLEKNSKLYIANNLNSENDPNESDDEEIKKAIEDKISIYDYYITKEGLLQSKIIEW